MPYFPTFPSCYDRIVTEAGTSCRPEASVHEWRQGAATPSVPLLSQVLHTASLVLAKAYWLSSSVPGEQVSHESV